MTLPNPDEVIVPLKPDEASWLSRLALAQGMSEAGVMRQALRLYQMAAVKQQQGLSMCWVDDKGELEPLMGKLKGLPDDF